MKHFLAIVYMVFCVFVVKAQDGEPLIYFINYNNLAEYNYITKNGKNIAKIISKVQTSDGDYSAFDAYNGRFFYVSAAFKGNNPFNDSVSLGKWYFVEINVANGEVKYHKTPHAHNNSFIDLHYDAVYNRLIYTYNGKLMSLELDGDTVKELGIISPLINYTNRKLTLFIPEKQQYLFGSREINQNDTQFIYYIYDFKTQLTKFFFSYPVMVKNFAYSKEYGLYGFTDYYYSVIPCEVVSVSGTGNVKILDTLSKTEYLFWGQNVAVYKDKYLISNGLHGYFFYFNLFSNQTEYTRAETIAIREYSEFHTFNKPYMQTSENTYTSTYGKSYRWLWNNQPIESSNKQTYTPTQCGDYKVEVTHLDGRIDTSEAIHYEVKDAKGNLISNTFAAAFPNPFHKNFQVQYKTCLENEVTFKIYDLQGKLVHTHKTPKIPAGEHAFEWNSQLQSLRYGLYIVQVFSGDDLISTQKVVKL